MGRDESTPSSIGVTRTPLYFINRARRKLKNPPNIVNKPDDVVESSWINEMRTNVNTRRGIRAHDASRKGKNVASMVNKPDDVDDYSWMNEVRNNMNIRAGRDNGSIPCTIFKVQKSIRKCNQDAYIPLVVTIGPYHRNPLNVDFKAMENYKWLCLRRLLFRHRSRSSATELLNKCLLEMKSLDSKVRSCYSESLEDQHLDAHSLALVMLLDGGFILYLLLKPQNLIDHVSNSNDPNNDDDNDDQFEDGDQILLERGQGDEDMEEPLLQTLWIWYFVLYDLLKLENQIPFFVLTKLFDLLKAPGDARVDLVKLAFKLFSDIHPSNSQTCPVLPPANDVHHLLHLFHYVLVNPINNHQIDMTQAVKAPKWIPNATELQQAGVKFIKKKNASSFLDIKFNNGTMEIPELCLYDYTDTLFRNLIAFEQCYPDTNYNTYITIYAFFMDCIIDTPKDVRLLHLNGILSNRLSTDEIAADLFNKLCYQIHYASDMNYLYNLFFEVN